MLSKSEVVVGLSKRAESFRSPSKSAKLARNGSSIMAESLAVASGMIVGEEKDEDCAGTGFEEKDGTGGDRGDGVTTVLVMGGGDMERVDAGETGCVDEEVRLDPNSERNICKRRSVSIVESVPGGCVALIKSV